MIHRGEIWWADFGHPRGSAPAFRHPALVLQRDEVNASTINTVVVCVLTSNTRLASAPGNTLLTSKVTRLSRPTVANASQVVTLDKSDLVERIGALPRDVMSEVDDGLRWLLALDLL